MQEQSTKKQRIMDIVLKSLLVILLIGIFLIDFINSYEHGKLSLIKTSLVLLACTFLVAIIIKYPVVSLQERIDFKKKIKSRKPITLEVFLELNGIVASDFDLLLARCYLETLANRFSIDCGKILPDDRFRDYSYKLANDGVMADDIAQEMLLRKELDEIKEVDEKHFSSVGQCEDLNLQNMKIGDFFMFIRKTINLNQDNK